MIRWFCCAVSLSVILCEGSDAVSFFEALAVIVVSEKNIPSSKELDDNLRRNLSRCLKAFVLKVYPQAGDIEAIKNLCAYISKF